MIRRSVVAGAVVALFACGSAFAQGVPKEMAWTAYDTGSSGFNIAVAIGQQFKQAYSSDVRILPSGNDTGRLSPVKANRALISQMGIGTYFAQEGVFGAVQRGAVARLLGVAVSGRRAAHGRVGRGPVVRARGIRTRALLLHVTCPVRFATDGAVRNKPVAWAGCGVAIAVLFDVAFAGRRPADRVGGLEAVGRGLGGRLVHDGLGELVHVAG